ncbi:MAG TPA: hypothetical protein VGQ65_17915 [Thermoanaerobaculia bacterium]|jgi:hypothetical protein|nr:hypothetical protein [Thermoanaerobaculia bacterium]
MSNEQKTPRTSARNGFLLGIGTAAIIGALAIVAVRYDGTAKATIVPPPEPVAAAPASMPIADHIAAVNAAAAEPTPATGAAVVPPSSKTPASVLLSGTIALDPSVAGSVTGPVTIFVIARDKAGKGHPILAKRLDVSSFPTKFTLGAGDSMMGGAPPNTVSLEARIDLDRDAMTKEPNAPSARIDTVALGTMDVTLTLK